MLTNTLHGFAKGYNTKDNIMQPDRPWPSGGPLHQSGTNRPDDDLSFVSQPKCEYVFYLIVMSGTISIKLTDLTFINPQSCL